MLSCQNTTSLPELVKLTQTSGLIWSITPLFLLSLILDVFLYKPVFYQHPAQSKAPNLPAAGGTRAVQVLPGMRGATHHISIENIALLFKGSI